MVFLWIILYEVTYTVSERLSASLHGGHGLTMMALMLYEVALMVYLMKHKKCRLYRVTMPRQSTRKDLLLILPMLGFPLLNVLVAMMAEETVWKRWDVCALILLQVVIEELCFRGYLPVILQQKYCKKEIWGSILIPNILFAGFHLVNLLQNASWSTTIVQLLCAFGIGVCLSVLVLRTHSIFPGVGIHFLINLTASNNEQLQTNAFGVYVFAAVLYLLYAGYMYSLYHKNQEEYMNAGKSQ